MALIEDQVLITRVCSATAKMGGKFEEEPGGLFTFSEAPTRIGVCRITWMACNSATYGGLAFGAILLLLQLTPPFRLKLDNWNGSSNGDWGLLQSLFLLGSELGLLAMIAFLTLLVPTLIMTWITALVFQHLFGRGLLSPRKELIQEGMLIAKDISWMAFKSMLRKANVAAAVVLLFALLALSFNGKNQGAEM